MQTAENQTVSLKAIDGIPAGLEIVAACPASPEATAAAGAVGLLLDAARAGIQCRADVSLEPGVPVSLGAPAPVGETLDNVTITRFRAFYPVVRSQLGGLDLAVVTTDTGNDASAANAFTSSTGIPTPNAGRPGIPTSNSSSRQSRN